MKIVSTPSYATSSDPATSVAVKAVPVLAVEDVASCMKAISKLAGDIEGLKKAVSQLQNVKPAAAPQQEITAILQTVYAVTGQVDQLTRDMAVMRQGVESKLEKPADPPQTAGSPPPLPVERKVAFLTKLWDYLNDVAPEIPLQK